VQQLLASLHALHVVRLLFGNDLALLLVAALLV
jgi:hypothetical protein